MEVELELIRLEEANKLLLKAIVFLHGKEKSIIQCIVDSNKSLINEYNKSELTIINPKRSELGIISSSLKKIVIGFYSEYINKLIIVKGNGLSYSERYHNCKCGSENLCEECVNENKEIEDFYDMKNELNKPYDLILDEIKERCNKTVLPKEIINAKILLMRKNPNYYQYNKLETETNEYLKIRMLEVFNEQNKDFINEKILSINEKQNNPSL